MVVLTKKCAYVSVTEELQEVAILIFFTLLWICNDFFTCFPFWRLSSFCHRIKVNLTKFWRVDSRGLGWHEVGIDPNYTWASKKHPKIKMMTRFGTLCACKTICAGPGLGEYSLGECSQSELSFKRKGINIASSP